MVTRFLVSGNDDKLMRFHIAVCMMLNAVARREQTVHYTCFGENRETAIEAGRMAGVTMQEIDADKEEESWTMVVQGDHPGWFPAAV